MHSWSQNNLLLIHALKIFFPEQVACPQTSVLLFPYIQSLRLFPDAAIEHKLQPSHPIHISFRLHRPLLSQTCGCVPDPTQSDIPFSTTGHTCKKTSQLLTNHLHSLCSPGTNASVSSLELQQVTSDEVLSLPALFFSGSSVTSPPYFLFPP